MKLRISDPVEILVDCDVVAVQAEDASGRFGILAGHTDFLTALEVSVVSWRDRAGRTGHCAVRRGILTVSGGNEIAIATREGHVSDDLPSLEAVVLARYRGQADAERIDRTASAKLRMQAIRRMMEALQGTRDAPAL